MKARNILLFILSCLALLAILSWAIPNGRIAIGDVTLRFPTIADVLDLNIPADSTPQQENYAEKMIRKHLEQKELDKKQQLVYKITHHLTPISVPNDSLEYFDHLFASLEAAKSRPMRIIHFGDSQIEEDRISGVVREQLQSQFGGHGVGLIPAIQTVPSTAIRQSCSADMRRYLAFGPANFRQTENRYGVMGQMAMLNGKAIWQFKTAGMKRTQQGTKHFDQITIMLGAPTESVSISATRGDYNSDTLRVDTTSQKVQFITIPLEGYGANATLSAQGQAEIYGILLDGKNGVNLDNVPMRGSSGTVFTGIAAETFTPYFKNYNVPLIILQYGGNTVPYLKGKANIDSYCASMARQIRYLKRVSPESAILFVGPSDMATTIDGEILTYPQLPLIVESLKTMCLENGIAYWDLFQAMGGKGSMINWVNVNPPLAGSDYVHFTPRGADHAANMLYESLMSFYSYYQHRNE